MRHESTSSAYWSASPSGNLSNARPVSIARARASSERHLVSQHVQHRAVRKQRHHHPELVPCARTLSSWGQRFRSTRAPLTKDVCTRITLGCCSSASVDISCTDGERQAVAMTACGSGASNTRQAHRCNPAPRRSAATTAHESNADLRMCSSASSGSSLRLKSCHTPKKSALSPAGAPPSDLDSTLRARVPVARAKHPRRGALPNLLQQLVGTRFAGPLGGLSSVHDQQVPARCNPARRRGNKKNPRGGLAQQQQHHQGTSRVGRRLWTRCLGAASDGGFIGAQHQRALVMKRDRASPDKGAKVPRAPARDTKSSQCAPQEEKLQRTGAEEAEAEWRSVDALCDALVACDKGPELLVLLRKVPPPPRAPALLTPFAAGLEQP